MSRATHAPRAVRLAGDCPDCGACIVVRQRRRDGERFVACSAYPRCDWACGYDAVLDEIDSTINRLQAEIRTLRGSSSGPVDLSRELRALIAVAHPDRWPAAADLAHEMTVRLTALRERIGGAS